MAPLKVLVLVLTLAHVLLVLRLDLAPPPVDAWRPPVLAAPGLDGVLVGVAPPWDYDWSVLILPLRCLQPVQGWTQLSG